MGNQHSLCRRRGRPIPLGLADAVSTDVKMGHIKNAEPIRSLNYLPLDLQTEFDFEIVLEYKGERNDEETKTEVDILSRLLKPEGLPRVMMATTRARILQDVNLNDVSYKKRKLRMCNKGLVQIYPVIGLQSRARSMALCCNKLTALPKEIGLLENLRNLDISKNNLEKLPDSIGMLKNLAELNVSANRLATLPITIGKLKSLRVLVASQNSIKYLPRNIRQATGLEIIDLQNNPLKWLPAEITTLPSIYYINVVGCPMMESIEAQDFEQQCSSHGAMSLYELAWRADLENWKKTKTRCFLCSGPILQYKKLKCRRVVMEGQPITIAYELCSNHWTDERSRLEAMYTIAHTPFGEKELEEEECAKISKPKVSKLASKKKTEACIHHGIESVIRQRLEASDRAYVLSINTHR